MVLSMAPPLPIRIPFWLLRSTRTVASTAVRALLLPRAGTSSTRSMLTATLWGTSSRVCISTCSRISSAINSRSG